MKLLTNIKLQLKIEELAMFALGIFAFNQLTYAWWWFLVLILLPDVGALGYYVNAKVGAISYNIFHNKAIAILVCFIGMYFESEPLKLTGVILFSHASMDRIFGYGLKFPDSFKNTHLGSIGKD